MGRLMGRRPDETERIARRAAQFLDVNERVIAGVYLQRPGTTEAQLEGGSSAAVTAAVGVTAYTIPGDDGPREWVQRLESFGVDPGVARRAIRIALVLTDSRLLLLRRGSTLTWRLPEVVAAWSLSDVDEVRVPRNGSTLVLVAGGRELVLELPQAHKFLPQVYRDLPKLVAKHR